MAVELYKTGRKGSAGPSDLFTLKVYDKKGNSISTTLSVVEWSELIAKPRIIVTEP